MNPGQERRYMRTPAAADYIESTPSTMEKWRVNGIGPPFCKSGRNVIYDREDLDAWLSARRRTSTSDTGSLTASEAR
jgi:hypothetical protein